MPTKRDLERRPLVDMIPIDTPFTGFIEPTNRCCFRCQFCPTGYPEKLKKVGRPTGDMSLEFAKNLIDGYAMFPHKLRMLNFQYMGEPLLNRYVTEMVAYAVDKDVAEWYEIRTNGYLLTSELNKRLAKSGLNRIGISIIAMDEAGYLCLTGAKIDYQRFLANLHDLYTITRGTKCEIYIKMDDFNIDDEEKAKFFETFSPIADDIQLEYLIDWTRNDGYDYKLGTNPDGLMMKGYKPYKKQVCPYAFYTLGFAWNGESFLCCMDWSYATSVGNSHQSTLQEIWNGERMRQFRIMQLENRRSEHPACGSCTALFMCQDNLDNHREEILARL